MVPCEVCDVLLDTREAMPHVMGHRHFNSAICIVNMQAELAEWRAGKRRVYWVFRLMDAYGCLPVQVVHANEKKEIRQGFRFGKKNDDKLIRITVGPRGNVRPWRKK